MEIYSDPAVGHQSLMGMNDGSLNERNERRRTRWTRAAIGLVLVISLLFVIVDSLGDRKVEATILNFLEWVQEHPFEGVLAVICVYIVATILFIPGSILTLGTGYAFGRAFADNTAFGVLLASTVSTNSLVVSVLGRMISTFYFNQAVFIGASLGSICSFILGRYLFRDCVMRLAASYPIFRAIDGGEFSYA